MTVWKNTRTLAKTALDAANALLKGTAPAATTTYNNGNVDVPSLQSPVVVVTQDNIKDTLIAGGAFQLSDFTGLK